MTAHEDSTVPCQFQTTHWSEIRAARTATLHHRQAVLENLARRYWKPVYSYLRANGQPESQARDITQDFFIDVVLGRDLFARADPHAGKFRSYILHCLKNYVRDWHRRRQARRRAPDGLILSTDRWTDEEGTSQEPVAPNAPPEQVFNQRWAASLLEQILGRLRTSCEESGLLVHLDIFQQRVVLPALEHAPPASLEELARQHNLSVKQTANRCETVRRRFRKLMLEEVRMTIADGSSIEDELRSLMGHLRRHSG